MAFVCCSAASIARSTAGGGSRSVVSLRSMFRLGSASPSSRTFSASSSLVRRSVMASCSVMGTVELSLMPLHSAEASARLNSLVAVNSSSWTWLTQGRALPL